MKLVNNFLHAWRHSLHIKFPNPHSDQRSTPNPFLDPLLRIGKALVFPIPDPVRCGIDPAVWTLHSLFKRFHDDTEMRTVSGSVRTTEGPTESGRGHRERRKSRHLGSDFFRYLRKEPVSGSIQSTASTLRVDLLIHPRIGKTNAVFERKPARPADGIDFIIAEIS